MKEPIPEPKEAALRSLLRAGRTTPDLPPRFQESVWRRIEDAELKSAPGRAGWIDLLIVRFLRPKLALAAAVVLVVTGAVLGARDGVHLAREDAQARYIASVDPTRPIAP